MTILNWAKNQTALILAGSISTATKNNYPTYFQVGTGSGTALATQTQLIAGSQRMAITSADGTQNYKVTFQGDWSSTQISGTSQITEFGMCGSATGLTGSIWSRTSFPGITFDGSNELRIEETFEIF